MGEIIKRFKSEPLYAGGILIAAIGLLTATEVLNQTLGGSITALLTAIFMAPKIGIIHNAVTPVEKVATLIDKPVGVVNELLKGVKL